MHKRMLKGLCLAFVMLSMFLVKAGQADTAIVPTDYPTVQQAVNAVQGTVDPLVIINSNSTFVETVTITQSVTIQAGTGYTPTIRGTSFRSTINFNPNSPSTQILTLRGLILQPRTGIGPGSGDYIIEIQNAGTGETNILIEDLILEDPENAGPDGINIRSGYGIGGGGPNNVAIQNTTITLGGMPSMGVRAIFMAELGALSVSNVIINMTLGASDGFDIRGSQGTGIIFMLEDSTFNITAPLASYSAEVGRLSDLVSAFIRGNTFNLFSNEQGYVTGIIAGWGSQDVILDSNRFNCSGPKNGTAYVAYASTGETAAIIATNNVIYNMGSALSFNASGGTPAGVINAFFTNNTIDGCGYSAVNYSLQDGTTVNAAITNNIFSNNAGYGIEGYYGTIPDNMRKNQKSTNKRGYGIEGYHVGGIIGEVTNSYNNFYNNTQGATGGMVSVGPNSIYVNPLYVDRAGGDLHIQPISTVINMGDNNAPELPDTDADGNPRVAGAAVDMGAYEVQHYILTIAAKTGGTTNPPPGSYTHDIGANISVIAIANRGYEFTGWSGDASGTANPINITLDVSKSITANFRAIPEEEAKKHGICFIATAAYGSPTHPHVNILRKFRDEYLLSNKLGCELVDLYYKYSPYAADLIDKHKVLKAIARVNLLPLVVFSYSMVHLGPIITGVMFVSVFALPIFLVSFLRRKIIKK